MRADSGVDITGLLRRVNADDRVAFDALVPLVYGHLRRLAHDQLNGQRSGHTLNTTALVHEAYVKLVDVDHTPWQGRAHFLAAASLAMRHVLVDHARSQNAQKRGGDWVRVDVEPDLLPLTEEYVEAEPGPPNSHIHSSIRPYREADDRGNRSTNLLDTSSAPVPVPSIGRGQEGQVSGPVLGTGGEQVGNRSLRDHESNPRDLEDRRSL